MFILSVYLTHYNSHWLVSPVWWGSIAETEDWSTHGVHLHQTVLISWPNMFLGFDTSNLCTSFLISCCSSSGLLPATVTVFTVKFRCDELAQRFVVVGWFFLSLSLSLFLSLSLSLSWMMMVTVVVVQALGNIGKGCFAFVGRGPLADVASIQIILFGKKRD